MLNTIISGTEITLSAFLICTGVSLLLGTLTALLSLKCDRCSQSFAIALAILPTVVRWSSTSRSASGTAREIGMIFLAMAIGLATGMGYAALAGLFFAIMAAFLLLLGKLRFGEAAEKVRSLRITIAESQDYDGLFDDLFREYTSSAELERVKTANMGTMYELDYSIVLRDEHRTKEFIDALRCRNGNLNIVCGRPVTREAL